MPVAVACECSNKFTLKDEYAGKLVRCPACGASVRAGALSPDSDADPIFGRDVFLMRQKIAISEKYEVSDEKGQPIVYVERPAHLLRNLAAVFAGVLAAMVVGGLAVSLSEIDGLPDGLEALLVLGGVAAAFVTFIVVAMALGTLRHVTFYRDAAKRQAVLHVRQDRKVQLVWQTFTLQDAQGTVLGSIRKHVLSNIVRKTWRVHAPDGRTLLVAQEDSVILSLLRRVLGPMYGLLRTNFILRHGESSKVLGEFKRKMTLLDKYVLDLTPDVDRRLDRRLALALGVLLDTGERR